MKTEIKIRAEDNEVLEVNAENEFGKLEALINEHHSVVTISSSECVLLDEKSWRVFSNAVNEMFGPQVVGEKSMFDEQGG